MIKKNFNKFKKQAFKFKFQTVIFFVKIFFNNYMGKIDKKVKKYILTSY